MSRPKRKISPQSLKILSMTVKIIAVMTMILSISQLSKNFGTTPILKNITFKIEEREKIAIVGVNGAGKTTLFKILAGQTDYDGGSLNWTKNCQVGYLTQHLDLDDTQTMIECMTHVFDEVIAMEKSIHELEEAMASHPDDRIIMTRYDQLMHTYQERDGYSYKSKIQGVLKGLGFTEEDFTKKIGLLSGGEKTRLCLARLLLKEPDLLLLDEPTNHLDIQALTWLEGYLKGYRNAVLLISHDRYFIDQVASSIIEIENGRSTLYKGNYQQYASQKLVSRQIELKHYIDQQKIIKKQEDSIALLRSFGREKQIRRAESKEKQLAKMDKLDRPESLPQQIRIQFQPRKDSGFEVLRVRHLSKSFSQPLFNDLTFDVKKMDRMAIVGPNGTGKTTFFKILLNELQADSGTFQLGSRVEMAYYDQEHASLDLSKTIFDDVHDTYPALNNFEIRQALAAFQFKGEDVFKEISVLSGGEKGRVVLCKLLLKQANFLILDEPTNHLDIQSKEVLEDALDSFEGTILFISHDRYFINKIANKVLDFNPDGAKVIDGNYDDYQAYKNRQKEIAKEAKPVSQSREEMMKKRRLENEIRKIETAIEKTEKEIAQLKELLQTDEVVNDYVRYNEITEQINQLEEKLEESMEIWENRSLAL